MAVPWDEHLGVTLLVPSLQSLLSWWDWMKGLPMSGETLSFSSPCSEFFP